MYHIYKKGNYTFEKYETGIQIEKAYLNGKVFVLKGGSRLIWNLSIISSILSVLWCIPIVLGSVGIARGELNAVPIPFMLFVFIFIGIILFVPTLFLFLCNRWFLVISPSGVYYRRNIKTGAFQWKDVTDLEGGLKTIKTRGIPKPPEVPTAQVIIYLSNGQRVGFKSIAFRNKEFLRIMQRVLFVRLFQIYSRIGIPSVL
ncbi:MAG: hypothetical protein KGD58_12460 [Candidatus Lokiarchaeota archaeon]|nr:hypothetical protein [Candidatus Lokiarchaeota archaeon]